MALAPEPTKDQGEDACLLSEKGKGGRDKKLCATNKREMCSTQGHTSPLDAYHPRKLQAPQLHRPHTRRHTLNDRHKAILIDLTFVITHVFKIKGSKLAFQKISVSTINC